MAGFSLSNLPIDLFLNILNIVLLFVIVRALAYKPVKKFMEARTARVSAEAEQAAEKAKAADETRAQYEAMLADGEAQKEKQLADAKQTAAAEAERILANARKEADDIVAAAQKKAQQTHDDALKNMQGDVVALAFDISEKLLEHSIRDADTKKMADRLFDSCLNGGKAQ